MVWTALYALFRVYLCGESAFILQDPNKWCFWLKYGKGCFHLYFLLLVLQFHLVLPLFLPLFRSKLRPVELVLSACFIQLIIYFLNRKLIHFRYPGTMALWYIPVLALGMCCGSRFEAFLAFWKRRQGWLLAAAVLGWSLYLPIAYSVRVNRVGNTLHYALATWFYTSVAPICLFGLAISLSKHSGALSSLLRGLGSKSLQIYLLHPAILVGLGRVGFPHNSLGIPAIALLYVGMAVSLSWLLAAGIALTPVSKHVFGRS